MTFPARVFRILIASPSDVSKERDIVVRAIQEWNALHAAERRVVLLPLRREIQSAPEYGRPQEILNRQVVDPCDLLVGIFWTRIGSPTGVADSGTLEEIERVASQGKLVMLYFSQAQIDPEQIELEQLQKLREFKKKTLPNALIENYSDHAEFNDKIMRHLETQVRRLLVEAEGESEGIDFSSTSATDIQLRFADPKTGKDIGTHIALNASYIEVTELDEVPDYESAQERQGKQSERMKGKSLDAFAAWSSSVVNKDYYRELITYVVEQNLFRPVRLWLKNAGSIGARDVYISLQIRSVDGEMLVALASKMKASPSVSGSIFSLSNVESEWIVRRSGDIWETHLEVRALQPQREFSPEPQFAVGAKSSCKLLVEARIFADTLPRPRSQTLEITLNVEKIVVSAEDLLKRSLAQAAVSF